MLLLFQMVKNLEQVPSARFHPETLESIGNALRKEGVHLSDDRLLEYIRENHRTENPEELARNTRLYDQEKRAKEKWSATKLLTAPFRFIGKRPLTSAAIALVIAIAYAVSRGAFGSGFGFGKISEWFSGQGTEETALEAAALTDPAIESVRNLYEQAIEFRVGGFARLPYEGQAVLYDGTRYTVEEFLPILSKLKEANPDILLGAEVLYKRPTALGWYHAIDAHLHKLGIEHVPYEQLEGGKLKIITDF